ncbi:hypothetical protein DFH09DRAFT_410032 [Mycena vulgaris]|nr:hypothetical protein DFH09DRAFT_410032 [Mycena vulgaris]
MGVRLVLMQPPSVLTRLALSLARSALTPRALFSMRWRRTLSLRPRLARSTITRATSKMEPPPPPPGFYSPYPPNYVNASPLSHYHGGGWNQHSPMVHALNDQLPHAFYTHSVSDLVPFEDGVGHGGHGEPPFGGMAVTMYGDAAQLLPSQLHPPVDGVQGGGSLSFMMARGSGEKGKSPDAAAAGGANPSV